MRSPRHWSLFSGKDSTPVVFHADDDPAAGVGLVQSNVKVADLRVAVVGPIARALDVVATKGNTKVRIYKLVKQIGVTTGSFYWHFRDRNDLLDQLLDYWTLETTSVVTDNSRLLDLDPKIRLNETARMIAKYGFNDYEVSMRAWALADERVAEGVNRVYKMRLRFIRKAFRELGFETVEAEIRARLFMCYHTWEAATFGPQSKKKGYLKAIERRVELLTRS
jgi:AcrR family transcriptional regulator